MKTELQHAQELWDHFCIDTEEMQQHAHTVQRWREMFKEQYLDDNCRYCKSRFSFNVAMQKDLDATIAFYREKGVLE